MPATRAIGPSGWPAGSIACRAAAALLAAGVLAAFAAAAPAEVAPPRGQRFVEVTAPSPERRYLEWISIFNEARRAALYSDDFLAALPDADPADFLAAAMAARRAAIRSPAASLADLVTYLPCDLLTKVDVASMAHGLECRQPFLDHRVVELAAQMPIGPKFRWGRGKRILHEAFRRPAAAGIRRPSGLCRTAGPLVSRPAQGHGPRRAARPPGDGAGGYFRREAIERLLAEHESRRFDHSYRLWSLLVLEWWHRQWVDA